MDFAATHVCIHCEQSVVFEEMTYDEVIEKWGREDLAEIPRVRCPTCRRIFQREALARVYDSRE